MEDPKDRFATTLDNTLSLLGGGVTATDPTSGADLVQEWIFVVQSDVSTQWVAEPLTKLRDALTEGDMHKVDELLHNLSGETSDLANNTAEGDAKKQLKSLASALYDFAQQFSQLTVQNNS
jgi:hypothetical protein